MFTSLAPLRVTTSFTFGGIQFPVGSNLKAKNKFSSKTFLNHCIYWISEVIIPSPPTPRPLLFAGWREVADFCPNIFLQEN